MQFPNAVRFTKIVLLYLVLAVVVSAGVPMLVGLFLAARLLIPTALCAGLAIVCMSPGARGRLRAAGGGKASW